MVGIGAAKFEVCYQLPRSRAKTLRTLKRGSFNSHTTKVDSITDLPGKPGFFSYGHDWYSGYPRSRSTWGGVTELSDEEEDRERTWVHEYLSRDGYRAVTLEMEDGKLVTVRSPEKAFTPEQFMKGPGKQILDLLARKPSRTIAPASAPAVRHVTSEAGGG